MLLMKEERALKGKRRENENWLGFFATPEDIDQPAATESLWSPDLVDGGCGAVRVVRGGLTKDGRPPPCQQDAGAVQRQEAVDPEGCLRARCRYSKGPGVAASSSLMVCAAGGEERFFDWYVAVEGAAPGMRVCTLVLGRLLKLEAQRWKQLTTEAVS